MMSRRGPRGHAQSWIAPRIEKMIYEAEAAVRRVLDL